MVNLNKRDYRLERLLRSVFLKNIWVLDNFGSLTNSKTDCSALLIYKYNKMVLLANPTV